MHSCQPLHILGTHAYAYLHYLGSLMQYRVHVYILLITLPRLPDTITVPMATYQPLHILGSLMHSPYLCLRTNHYIT